jgi:hypothetical protein
MFIGFSLSSHKNVEGMYNDFPLDLILERAVVLVLGGRFY